MKLTTFLFLFFFIPFAIFGQTFFGPQHVLMSTEISVDNPEFVYAADLDGDGDMDVVSVSRTDSKIAWYENIDSSGVFGNQHLITTEVDYAFAVFAADLDGDEDYDLLSASWVDDKIAWYENLDGLGNFGDQQIISIEADGAGSVHAADIDGDGDMDVLSASFFDSSIKWYMNEDGLGTFGDPQVISNSILSASYVTAADIDGDGDMDVFCTSSGTDKVAWFENVSGNGVFGPQQIISTTMDGAIFINVVDVNGDEYLDVIAASSENNKIAWFENLNGEGNFGTQHIITSQADYVLSIRAGDFDGDGDNDLVSASYDDNKIAWYKNENGSGNFGPPQLISLDHKGATSVFASDFDNDGDLDVLACSRLDDKIAWYGNIDGEGAFETQQIIATKANGQRAVHSADLNGDGNMDILSASQSDDKVIWFKNIDGSGSFKIQQIITSEADVAESVFAADIDGDGDMDVLSASRDDDKIAWYNNLDGEGTFGDQEIITTQADGASSVFAVDLDGDGDNDVLSTSFYDNKIAWYENEDGLGSFSNQQVISTEAVFARFVRAIDLDNDGDMDVLSASSGDDKVAWYENLNGLGDFGDQQIISSIADEVFSVYGEDIDFDGDNDVIAALRFSGKIVWYENEDGQGSFGNQKIISTQVPDAWHAYASDMDNDGDLDALSVSNFNNEITWYENEDGDGNFGVQQIISSELETPNYIITADLDNDGDKDVISASWFDGKIAWYENLFSEAIVSGVCYYDENENAMRDSNELVLFNQTVTIDPESITSFTNNNGSFNFVLENGNYTVSVIPDEYWEVTNNPPDYNIFVQDTSIQNLDFGLFPYQDVTDVTTTMSSAPTRCGFDVPFWINYENEGTTYASGLIEFEIDPLASFISAVPSPDSIAGNYYYWKFDSLPPTHYSTIDLIIEMPGVEYLGEIITFYTSSYIEDDLGALYYNYTYAYRVEINCSFDPNDKLVRPEGELEQNYTLFGEELEYTIRFQNTGTDTAFTVRLEDQLDENLDWSTFRPIGASHPYQVTLNGNGMVEFLFENILLPDSTSNEIESHGFAKYRIKHIEGLSENTEIQNNADIFFDFNPAIQTNTTLNTLVSEIPVSIKEPEQKIAIDIFPNPFEDYTTIRIGELPGRGKATLNLLNVNGRLLKNYEMSSNSELQIKGREFPSGIYFYELKNRKGVILGKGKMIKQ